MEGIYVNGLLWEIEYFCNRAEEDAEAVLCWFVDLLPNQSSHRLTIGGNLSRPARVAVHYAVVYKATAKGEEGMTASKRTPWIAYALMFIPAAVVTWLLHELAHWAMGEALGYDMWMSFNGAGLEGEGPYDSALDRTLVDAAGPVLTYILAIGAFALIRATGSLLLYPFLFLQFYMRAVALGLSVLSLPNDEARISLELGLPLWLLPGIAVTLLLALTVIGSRMVSAGWAGNLIAYVMASLLSTAIVFLDPGPLL